jgi:tripartite-type tricarboxylate transporter receptor subunit TctC
MGLWRGFCLKKGTPPEIVQYIEAVIRDCFQDSVFLEFKQKRGYIRPDYKETPAEFEKSATKELEQIQKAIDIMRKGAKS